MRILIANHQFFPAFYTGTERFSFNIAKQLQRMGHYVEIVTYGVVDNPDDYVDEYLSIKWREYVFSGIRVTAIRHRKMPAELNSRIFDEGVYRFFTDFLGKKQFDLVHVAHPMRTGSAANAARQMGIPVILTLTDFWLLCPSATLLKADFSLCTSPRKGKACCEICFAPSMGDSLEKRFAEGEKYLQMMDGIFAPSNFLIQMFQKSIPDVFINLIRHGIDYSKGVCPKADVRSSGRKLTFGFIGTILKHKGLETVVRAFQKVAAEDVRLDIYGGCFHETQYYAELLKTAKNDGRIRFLGEYRHDELSAILSGMDFVVVPSLWWENSPLTVLTSLAHRTPVIVSDIGGLKEFVQHDVNGYRFAMGDADALAALIDRIASDRTIVKNLCRQIQLPPRIEEEAFQYEMVYQGILRKPAGQAITLSPKFHGQ